MDNHQFAVISAQFAFLTLWIIFLYWIYRLLSFKFNYATVKTVTLNRDDVIVSLVGVTHQSNVENFYEDVVEYVKDFDIVLYEGVYTEDSIDNDLYEYNKKLIDKINFNNTSNKSATREFYKVSDEEKHKWIRSDIHISELGQYQSSYFTDKGISNKKHHLDPLVFMRDHLVISDCIKEVAKGNKRIAIIYGDGHVKGMTKILKLMNFNIISTIKRKNFIF